MEKELLEVKQGLDQILFETSFMTCKLQALFEMVTGVYKDTLAPDTFNEIIKRYVLELEEKLNISLNGVEGVLYAASQGDVTRKRFEYHEYISYLKRCYEITC